jgi:hypothetical protein
VNAEADVVETLELAGQHPVIEALGLDVRFEYEDHC